MIALDYIVASVLSPASINANIQALNGQYAALVGYAQVPTLDNQTGVINMWTKAWSDLVPPVVGFEIGFLREAPTEVVLAGKNRDQLPCWITYVAKPQDEAGARRDALVTFEAVRMLLDLPAPQGLEGQILPNVTPIRALVLIDPKVGFELVTVDVTAGGKKLGFRSKWLLTLDTVRS